MPPLCRKFSKSKSNDMNKKYSEMLVRFKVTMFPHDCYCLMPKYQVNKNV